jgi:hypothetical protein
MARTFIVSFVLMLLDAPGLVCAESPGASPLPSTSITPDYTQGYILTFKSEGTTESSAAFGFLLPQSWLWDGLAWTAEIVALRDENIRALKNLSLSHERN